MKFKYNEKEENITLEAETTLDAFQLGVITNNLSYKVVIETGTGGDPKISLWMKQNVLINYLINSRKIVDNISKEKR